MNSLGTERMSTETEQEDLGVCNFDRDFLRGVVSYMSENKNFRGSATELLNVLGFDVSARVISVELKKAKDELENLGISITWSRKRNKRIVTIANSAVASQNELSLRHIEKTTPRDNGFASHIEKEPIRFPFSWQYGEIVELSEEEKNEVNRMRYQGKKSYQKPCSVCGEEGHLQFRKTSDNNSSLICESCAKKYVSSALNLQVNGVGCDLNGL